MAAKPYKAPDFPVSFKNPDGTIDRTTSQATAMTTAAPPTPQAAPIVHDVNSYLTIRYFEPAVDEALAQTMDAIILAGNDYCVLSRLQSGSIRTDRRAASPEEIELMARDKRRRQANRYTEVGSNENQPTTTEKKL